MPGIRRVVSSTFLCCLGLSDDPREEDYLPGAPVSSFFTGLRCRGVSSAICAGSTKRAQLSLPETDDSASV